MEVLKSAHSSLLLGDILSILCDLLLPFTHTLHPVKTEITNWHLRLGPTVQYLFHLFVWLHQVLVAASGIFICST